MPPRLSVSLISTNEKHFLERLLPSLMAALHGIPHEILLVDNVCSDSTAAFIQSQFPEIAMRRNEAKLTYGGNHNRNIGLARGEFILIMNSDMTVAPDAIATLLDYMQTNPDIGVLSPRVLNEDGTDQFLNKRYPSVLDLFLHRLAPRFLQPLFRKRIARYEMRDSGYECICDVDCLTGAFMFCRADVLRKVGGFDPLYRHYFEDFDLCRKVQRTHRTVYFPGASVVHYWQRAPHKSLYSTWLATLSALRYFNRWGYRLI